MNAVSTNPENLTAISLIFLGAILLLVRFVSRSNRKSRLDYYKNVYLKSDDWRRKRFVVLKRDNWQCVYCGAEATQVHHKRYARRNIGSEPIDWLVSVCNGCHESLHHVKRKSHSYKAIERTPVTARSELQDWLKANPGKSINDYFSKFGA